MTQHSWLDGQSDVTMRNSLVLNGKPEPIVRGRFFVNLGKTVIYWYALDDVSVLTTVGFAGVFRASQPTDSKVYCKMYRTLELLGIHRLILCCKTCALTSNNKSL